MARLFMTECCGVHWELLRDGRAADEPDPEHDMGYYRCSGCHKDRDGVVREPQPPYETEILN